VGDSTKERRRREGIVSSLREARKQATRSRVLDAASELFDRVGYDEATIRDIAKAAGVSVGSVFSSFRSKSDVLSEVMQARLGDLYADLARAAPHLEGSTVDRCRSLFAVHYAFEFRNVQLFLAYLGAAFDWRGDPAAPRFSDNRRLRGMVHDCLVAGIESGDVRPDADLDTATELLIAAYGWNYRHAARQETDAGALIQRLDRQIAVIFEGLAPRTV
jgi:AcrR family transcriptional regulator